MAEERDAEAKRIGELIANLRLSRGWNQQDLANEIDVGVSTVSRWERGLHKGEAPNVRKLARALKVDPAVLRPVEPEVETQLDRIEAQLAALTEAVNALHPGAAEQFARAFEDAVPGTEHDEPEEPRSATGK
jgi:transcriptional regulator with XRE-family HTH domain